MRENQHKSCIVSLLFLLGYSSLQAGNAIIGAEIEGDTATIDIKAVSGHQTAPRKISWGKLSGSFETNTIYYKDDKKIGAKAPKDNYGSNNYLKLDYTNGRFSAGIQAEWYPQVLQGYENGLEGFGLAEKYISWTGQDFSVTVGDFYEQFGSGLILRAWEDRALGFNNSIGGVRATFNVGKYAAAKVLYGYPRDYMRREAFGSYTGTQVLGADLSFSLSDVIGLAQHHISLEGSVVDRIEKRTDDFLFYTSEGFAAANGCQLDKTAFMSYSGRLAYEWNSFSLKGEYVYKGKDVFQDLTTGKYELRSGNAILAEANYSGNGLSVTGMFRRLDNMQNNIYHTIGTQLTANTLNYLPALCPQHTYMLAVLNPFTPYVNGEIGGQLDIFYRVKKGTWLGGSRGLKLHGNVSLFNSLGKANMRGEDLFLYRDITFDVEKNWNKKLKTILFASIQEFADDEGKGGSRLTTAQNVFVGDVTYKFTPKWSLRGEVQYLYSEETTKGGDWMAALLEVGYAPQWSVFISDMYNHGNKEEKVHYYSAGVSYTYGSLRAALSYGRNRAGYVCSGGVCRYQPAYTGGNLALTYVF